MLIFLLVYSVVYAFFFPAMQVLLARSGSTWQSADPRRLWKTTRAHFIPYLLVFLIVGLALFNIVLVLAALTAFLLLPPAAGVCRPGQRTLCRANWRGWIGTIHHPDEPKKRFYQITRKNSREISEHESYYG